MDFWIDYPGLPYYLRSLYNDSALSASIYSMKPLLELLNPSHLMFGSDFQFATEFLVGKEIHDINELNILEDKMRIMIEETKHWSFSKI